MQTHAPTATTPAEYLAEQTARGVISPKERAILAGYIDHRNTIRPTFPVTKKKQAFQGVWVCRVLHEQGVSLDSCTARDLLTVASRASSGKYTQNTRQSKIAIIKGLAKYRHRFYRKIKDYALLSDIKSGGIDRQRKPTLSQEEWERILNLPMSARERAMIAMLYDGYHRPTEILILSWSDLRVNPSGRVEYEITFKTPKTRTIVQKGTTTAILEMWRQELGANYGDETPLFPDREGRQYQTTAVLRDLVARLRKKTGLKLTPGMLRNTAITHDVQAGLPTSYICLRAWGEPFNPMINVYARPDSGRMQEELHAKIGLDEIPAGKTISRRSIVSSLPCPGCGTPNLHSAVLCYQCGRPLTEDVAALDDMIMQRLHSRPELIDAMVRRSLEKMAAERQQ